MRLVATGVRFELMRVFFFFRSIFFFFENSLAKFMPAEQPQQPMMMMPQQPMQQMPMQVQGGQAPAAAPAALVQDIASLVSNQHQFKN